jgi:hypothetical protein
MRLTTMAVPDELLPPPGLATIDVLFVQTARSAAYAAGLLTLHGLSRSTLYFADRPQRVVGHLHSQLFVAMWDSGLHSFADDPPNAVLSFIEAHGTGEVTGVPDDVVVVLRSPRLDTNRISYYVDVLDGTLPIRSGGCALFIDSFGRPVSPVLLAAMQRLSRFPWHARDF